uniref:Uncharacterized protein n=1 Tax=Anguilla anguilla TaxID=7936 RepID=A0A0E9U105_ANGAN
MCKDKVAWCSNCS